MKILHFHRSLGAGGIESMVCNLANEMAKTEDVTVGTIFRPLASDLCYKQLSSQVKKIDLGKTDETIKPIREIFKIYFVIKKGNYDIVHIHGYFYYYFFAILMLHSKVKFFYTLHNDAYKEGPSWDIKLLRFKKLFFQKRWMRPITISNASQKSFYELYGCSSILIPNGIAQPQITESGNFIESNRISPATKVFINAGRIHEQKNQVMLCRVFDCLIKEGYDIMLYIAGCIQDWSIYNQMKPFFSERIIFLDQRDDIPSLLAKADGMCLSSNYEGLPVVLLESLAVGCVPICTPVGGIINVIHNGVDGLLSKSAEEEDYLNVMKNFLDNKYNQGHLKLNALKLFSSYKIELTASKYLAAYKEV